MNSEKSLPLGQVLTSSPPIIFGGGAISGEGKGYSLGAIEEREAVRLVRKAWERGIKVFDTAPIYGFGFSEKRLGIALKKVRLEAFIISKSGVGWHENKRVNVSNAPELVEKMLEQTLKNLQTDYLDLYMIHWPDQRVDIRRPLEIYRRYQEKGVIKHIGLCNTDYEDLKKAREIVDVAAIQSEFHLFTEEKASQFATMCKEGQCSFMSWGTLDKGTLVGRVHEKKAFDPYDMRSYAYWRKKNDFTKKYPVVEELKKLAAQHGHSLLELALGHNLRHSFVNFCICSLRTPLQLDEVLKALENLPREEVVTQMKRIKRRVFE